MRKQAISANTLVVGIGAALLFGIGVVHSFINSSDWTTNKGTQVQPAVAGNTTEAQPPVTAP